MKASYSNSFRFFQSRRSSSAVSNGPSRLKRTSSCGRATVAIGSICRWPSLRTVSSTLFAEPSSSCAHTAIRRACSGVTTRVFIGRAERPRGRGHGRRGASRRRRSRPAAAGPSRLAARRRAARAAGAGSSASAPRPSRRRRGRSASGSAPAGSRRARESRSAVSSRTQSSIDSSSSRASAASRGADPSLRLLVLGDAAVVEVEGADQRAERQALQHERGEDDAEGEEDDQLAVGKARAGVGRQRQRQRGRERDRAAHPGPGNHGLRPPRGQRDRRPANARLALASR